MLAESPLDEAEPRDGAPASADALFSAHYRELRRLAHARLRGGCDTLLDAGALVHETYLRLVAGSELRFPDPPRFLAYAARVMRSIIIDSVRQRRAERRGGDVAHVTLTAQIADEAPGCEPQVLRVHEALHQLASVNIRMAQVVGLRHFGGLTDAEIALALGVTDRTVRRDWEQARQVLATALA